MNKLLINIISAFIIDKKKRKIFRTKWLKKRSNLVLLFGFIPLFTIKFNDEIKNEIDNIKNLMLFPHFIDNLPSIDTAKFTKTINPNEPHIPIFLSSDDNYAPFIATTAASICYNTNSFVDIYVLGGGIKEYKKNKILELEKQFNNVKFEFVKIDLEKEFQGFQKTYHTLSAYNRLLIPQITKLNKILYFDVDLVVLSDVLELYEENLDDKIIACTFEQIRNGVDGYKISEFNTGVMVMDSEKWRRNNITKECFEVAKKYKGKLHAADQSILNKVFENENYKKLDKKWNVNSSFDKNQDIMNIRHWAGDIKPWISIIHPKNANLFWFYAKMTPFFEEIKENFINSST
ncbi:MAG: hypothetical protein Ta2D_02080 [Rickettsiales bacterium]|nr:MAG: hypothetical protein Ta2D_02080 [Rickettsiales bacterium]